MRRRRARRDRRVFPALLRSRAGGILSPPAIAQASRLHERVEELCAASIRALSGIGDLTFRGRRLHRGARRLPLFAPHLQPSHELDDFGSFRGAADGLALRLTLSDADLHASLAPVDPVEQLVFGWLEQFRVESLAPPELAGMQRNLRHRHETWSRAFHDAGHIDSARGLLLYTVAQIARARVTGEPVVEATEGRIEATRFALAPSIGHALAGLRRERSSQAAFAVHARAIAAVVAAMLKEAGTAPGEAERGDDDEPRERAGRSTLGLILEEVEDGTNERFATAVASGSNRLDDGGDDYRIFTTVYDKEAGAAALVRGEVLAEYRSRLDATIGAHHVRVAQLARSLRTTLSVPTADGWDGSQEEGRIDGTVLARMIAAPAERRIFRQDRIEPTADAALLFLVDCTGSMKVHAERVAMLVDVFARACDMAGVSCEILGFSTGAWNGGQARRDWLRAGKPPHPGRLNERLHIRFKPFETSWRRGRKEIAALYRSDLFREGLDGEAVEWAAGRLDARAEGRKIMFVVSDGSPMDGATASSNRPGYLDRHLQQVTGRIEAAGRIELHGLGVGLDLSPFYRSSHLLDLGAQIGNAMYTEVVRMIARGKRQR